MTQELNQVPAGTDTGAAAAAQAPSGTVTAGQEPATAGASCPTCATSQANPVTSYVYAIGRVEARFPRLSVEKEFAQVTGRADAAGLTDQQAFHAVLAQPENRYLARQMCWVMTIQGLETYLLSPTDPADYGLLVEAIRPEPDPRDVDAVIGARGPIAPPELCNGLMLPIVWLDQVYSFDRAELIKALPRPEKVSEKQFEATAAEVLDRVIQVTDNAGATDEHRALNYLAMRYPTLYAHTAGFHARDFALSAVETRESPLSGARKIIEVIFSHTNRATDFTEKSIVRVDVSEEFPFLVTKMTPYYDR